MKHFPDIVITPDGKGNVKRLDWPTVYVIFPDGSQRAYDVDDCEFPCK